MTSNRFPAQLRPISSSSSCGTIHPKPELQLREDGPWPPHSFSPWADKGRKRRLWNERSVARAIEYVLYDQGGDLPDFDD